MEEYLRYGLLCLAALIIGFILIESRWRYRRFKAAEITHLQENSDAYSQGVIRENIEPTWINQQDVTLQNEAMVEAKPHSTQNEYLALSVFAKNQAFFESYDLFQAISATGMQLGEMNIFHYYLPTDGGKQTLFSLASATKPGYFDMDKMGGFTCRGLTLFMTLSQSNPIMAFNKMLKAAEQLADDLDGELRADPYTPWNDTTLAEYRKKIQQFHL